MEEELIEIVKKAIINNDIKLVKEMLEYDIEVTGLLKYAKKKEIIERLLDKLEITKDLPEIVIKMLDESLSNLTVEEYINIKKEWEIKGNKKVQLLKALKKGNKELVKYILKEEKLNEKDIEELIIIGDISEYNIDYKEINIEKVLKKTLRKTEPNEKSFKKILLEIENKEKYILKCAEKGYIKCIKEVEGMIKEEIKGEIAKKIYVYGIEIWKLEIPNEVYNIIKRYDYERAKEYIKREGKEKEYSEYIAKSILNRIGMIMNDDTEEFKKELKRIYGEEWFNQKSLH